MLRIKIARFIPFFIIIIFAIAFVGSNLFDRKEKISLQLDNYSDTNNVSTLNTIQRYNNIEVQTKLYKEIIINKPGIMLGFFAPGRLKFMDNLRLLFVIIGGVIFIITFWNFSYQNPFTKQTTSGMRLLTITMFVYISVIIMRNYWLNNYLLKQTGQSFHLENENIIFSAEFLLSAIFLRITKVFKKGTILQQEQDLTV